MVRRLLSISLLLTALAACGGEEGRTKGDGASPRMLPDAFYGTWEHTGTSGGLDGKEIPLHEGAQATITITRDNQLVFRSADGSQNAHAFTVDKGKTIYSSEPQWMVLSESGDPLVLRIAKDGTLTTSDNAYDGYSSTYRRVGGEK